MMMTRHLLTSYQRAAVSTLRSGSGSTAHYFHLLDQRRSHYQYHGPGSSPGQSALLAAWKNRDFSQRGFSVGIGGPVGSGKTATVLQLCRALQELPIKPFSHLGVVTNDIFTQEDKEYLVKQQALPRDHIRAVETGGCPHAAIREDVSANLAALEDLTSHFHQKEPIESDNSSTAPLLLCESGGDNLAANFSRELADLIIQVIDVAGGDKIPRKGGPGITQSDLLVINKCDLATAVGADLTLMKQQAQDMRRIRHNSNDTNSNSAEHAPIVMAAVKNKEGLPEIVNFILHHYQMAMELSQQQK
mmetsp:Transcript_16057/g.44197  ORF Transcript_16057/g.44197 Transcript_16057/m.44197 type:complete len:303 (-) Transcript_16057:18-926(-)